MALLDVYNALQAALSGSPAQIDLYAASGSGVLLPLRTVLGRFGIASSWTLTNALLSQPADSVVLTGEGLYGPPGAPPIRTVAIRALLTVASVAGVDAFSLALTVVGPWSFSRSFPSDLLPQSQRYRDDVQGVQSAPSFLIGLAINKVTLTARSNSTATALEFQGELPGIDSLPQAWADWLGPWPLRASGWLQIPPNAWTSPTCEIDAFSSSASIVVGPVSVRPVGVRLAIETGFDPVEVGATGFSTLYLLGYISFAGTTAAITCPLLAMQQIWHLQVDFAPKDVMIGQTLAAVGEYLGVPASGLSVPEGFDSFLGFYLSQLEIDVALTSSGFDLQGLAVTLASDKVWAPPVPKVLVQEVGTRWYAEWDETNGLLQPNFVAGSVYGTLVIGSTPSASLTALAPPFAPGSRLRDPSPQERMQLLTANTEAFRLDLAAYLPQFVLNATLRAGDVIPITQAFRYFFEGDPGPATPSDMVISRLQFEADLRNRTLDGGATIDTNWTVALGANVSLTLVDLTLQIAVAQNSITASIAGNLSLHGAAPPGFLDPYFTISAEYQKASGVSGWTFAGSLYPGYQMELVSLVSNFLGIDPPSSLPTLVVERLSGRFSTGDRSYSFAGTFTTRWTPTLFGQELAISASAAVDITGAGNGVAPVGTITGTFAINKFSVSAGINLREVEPTYVFRVQYDQLWLQAVTAWRDNSKDKGRHQVLTLQLGGISLGAVLEYLLRLASPTSDARLDAPWDALNQIDLSRFSLTVDPTENSVEFLYSADVNLVFARLDTIGVRYRRTDGEPDVSLLLTGRFLDKVYDSGRPLAWNVITETPPAVPGQGASLLDVRYLGLGQRVSLRAPLPDTVADTLKRMAKDMQPSSNPAEAMATSPGMGFAAESGWLIGLDVTLLDTLQLGVIFNDPQLYGLSIGLDGERAGSLAGLRFEILYKKITDSIGMFRIELRLPEAFRHIELGEVSITLGVIVVEIYTNGNFLIDLGFPYNRDFSRSFTVQVFPFLGRGGIYFGLLDGNTSRRVPRVTNGDFSPVLELGIGLAVGVGKEITLGPLSGGAFVQVEVIFQGVLGWFHPQSSGADTTQFYWVQGIAAIHGKVYGQVDFKVIKVSATIEAFAQVSVVFEAYRAAVFALSVGVRVEAEVEFLFFSVSFSFDEHLDVSFTIGNDTPTPWILAGASDAPRVERGSVLRGRRGAHQRSILAAHHLEDALRRKALHRAAILPSAMLPGAVEGAAAAEPDEYLLVWDPDLAVFPDAPLRRDCTVLPAFGVTDVPVSWDGYPPAATGPASYRIALLLFAPNGVPPGAPDVETAARERSPEWSARAAVNRELTADTLIEAFLRWSIAAVLAGDPIPGGSPGGMVSAGQMLVLTEQMDWPATADTAFTFDNLRRFYTANVQLAMRGEPTGPPASVGGMVMPLPPVLTWTSPQGGAVDLSTQTLVGPLYEFGARQYMGQTDPMDQPERAAPADDPAAYESFATFLFRDWCLMVAKSTVKAASDCLTDWTVPVLAPVSLAEVALQFPSTDIQYSVRSGDTLSSVASALGETPNALAALNPGLDAELAQAAPSSLVAVALGVAAATVGYDNRTVPLATTAPLQLGDVAYQIRESDTLASIAARFSKMAIDLFTGTLLADDPLLLLANAPVSVPSKPWPVPPECTPLLASALLYVRLYLPLNVPGAQWYAQTIFDLNAFSSLAGTLAGEPIPAGTVLLVPASLTLGSPPDVTTYVSLPGDTLERIGAALALAENYPTGTGPNPDWPAFRDAVQISGGTITPPSTQTRVLPRDTINAFAQRTLLDDGNLPGLLLWLASQAVLSPLAVMNVPSVQATPGSAQGTTLEELAATFGLTVDDLAGRVQHQLLFDVGTGSLTVAHVPVQYIDAVVDAVLGGTAPANISGMCSRFLLAGLRLPAPVLDATGHAEATGPLTAMADLSGQQFAGPAPDPHNPDAVAFSLTLAVLPGNEWITLVSSTAVGHADEETYLSQFWLHADDALRQRNPALRQARRMRLGLVLETGEVSTLVFSYTNAQLEANYPGTELWVYPARGPEPMKLSELVAPTWGLDHGVELQVASPLPIPQGTGAPALAGNPTAWMLSKDLLGRNEEPSGVEAKYAVLQNVVGRGGRSESQTVESATFACLCSFTIKRLSSRDRVYELSGPLLADRDLLLSLVRFLDAESAAPTVATMAVTPAPDAAISAGLSMLACDVESTYLLCTNETTISTPDVLAMEAAFGGAGSPSSPYFASFADLRSFLLLLWKGSTVGGAGYFLGVRTLAGNGLPASAFSLEGTATLSLLIVVSSQQQPAPAGRSLLPFNNCVLTGAGVASDGLFLEALDETKRQTVSTVEPGNIGFTFTLPRPASPAPLLERLFSLGTWHLPSYGSPFTMAQAGPPLTPQAEDGLHLSRYARARRRRLAGSAKSLAAPLPNSFWRYDKVFPVSRFGPPSPAPLVSGLPDPASDPYRGIGAGELAFADVDLGFCDVLGNVTEDGCGSPPAGAVVSLPVGYTDPLLSPGQWPAITYAWDLVATTPGAADLVVSLYPQPGAVTTGPGQDAAVAIEAARRQTKQYSTAYFQIVQPGVTAATLTTLNTGADGGPVPLPADLFTLRCFVTANYLASNTAASLTTYQASGTLSHVVSTYGVRYADLAAANLSKSMASLFGEQTVTIPAYLPFSSGASANLLLAGRPAGWPAPASGSDLLTLAENSSVLPLRIGVCWSTPPHGRHVGSSPGLTLAEFAAENYTTPGLLAQDNATNTLLLQPGFVFVYDGLQVMVGGTGPDGLPVLHFAGVAAAFAALGALGGVAEIAVANADAPEIFLTDGEAVVAHYIAQPDDTLDSNRSGAAASDLASLNGDTVNVFDDGAMVFLGSFPDPPSTGTLTTLGEFARQFACPPELLLFDNAQLPLAAGTSCVVPGTVQLPADLSAIRQPYTVAGADTLTSVAALFAPPASGDAVLALAANNLQLPGTLSGGKEITVLSDGTSFSTQTMQGDSFGAVLERLQAEHAAIDLATVVAAIGQTPGYLAAGALLVCGAASLPATNSVGRLLSVAQAAAAYGVEPTFFAQANSGVLNLLGLVTLHDSTGDVAITTGNDDSFNSVLSRFAAKGVTLTLGDLVAANLSVPCLRVGVAALLPAQTAVLTTALPQPAGPFPGPIFPLQVSLTLRRAASVISPEFASLDQPTSVELAVTAIPAAVSPSQSESQDSIADFGKRLHATLPALWLGTGASASAADLWALWMGTGGIAELSSQPGVSMPDGSLAPRFLALQPLYTDLQNRFGVEVRDLTDAGQLGDVRLMDFQSVDVEVWAQGFLSDIDLFLSAAYATGAYENLDARAALAELLECKQRLSAAIPQGLAAVLQVSDPKQAAGLQQARGVLQEQLATSLSAGYSLAVLLQYDCTANTAWTGPLPVPTPPLLKRGARLAGTPVNSAPAAVSPATDLPYSIGGAKLSLDQSSSFLTLPLRLADPSFHRSVAVDLDFVITDLEYDVEAVAEAPRFEASKWLALVPRIRQENAPAVLTTWLGSTEAPIALRSYPPVPILKAQSTSATFAGLDPAASGSPGTGFLEDRSRWTYSLTYAHEHAEQDEVAITVVFNPDPPPPTPAAVFDPGDVAVPLAQYTVVAPKLASLMAGFADSTLAVDALTLGNAARTLSEVASKVASAWEQTTYQRSRESKAATRRLGVPQKEIYTYTVRWDYRLENKVQVFDKVTLLGGRGGPGPLAQWPAASYVHASGTLVPLPAVPIQGGVEYRFPAPSFPAGTGWPTMQFGWTGLPIARYEKGTGSLSVQRNHHLLGLSGPETSTCFLYSTPIVEPTGPVTPLLEWAERLDITALGATPGQALQAAFDALFGDQKGMILTIGVQYGLELVPPTDRDSEGLVSYLPVTLYPHEPLSDSTAATLQAAITAWADANHPVMTSAEWVFSITLYSSGSDDRQQALLLVSRLVWRQF